jgi:hypothetical protein
MKDDAFDDLRCPFNYKAEVKRVRKALNARHSGTTRVWATLGFKGRVFRTPLAPIRSYEFQV